MRRGTQQQQRERERERENEVWRKEHVNCEKGGTRMRKRDCENSRILTSTLESCHNRRVIQKKE